MTRATIPKREGYTTKTLIEMSDTMNKFGEYLRYIDGQKAVVDVAVATIKVDTDTTVINAYEKESLCGTTACVGGYYALYHNLKMYLRCPNHIINHTDEYDNTHCDLCTRTTFNASSGQTYVMGAELLAKDLGFESAEIMYRWFETNPKIWNSPNTAPFNMSRIDITQYYEDYTLINPNIMYGVFGPSNALIASAKFFKVGQRLENMHLLEINPKRPI